MFRRPVVAAVFFPLCIIGTVLGLWLSTRSDSPSTPVVTSRQSDGPSPPHSRAANDSMPSIRVSDFPPPTPSFEVAPTPSINASKPAQAEAPVYQSPSEWPREILQAPDPNTRLAALESWAREPEKYLNLVAMLMIDPDESIRQRAQEIYIRATRGGE